MSTTYWTAGSREEEASEQQCGKTAEEETNTEFRHARLMNDYYEDYYEDKQYGNEIWRSYSNQCDNSTISSVDKKADMTKTRSIKGSRKRDLLNLKFI